MRVAVVVLAVTVGGCAPGLNESSAYQQSKPSEYTDVDGGWLIFDMPVASKLMITPSRGRAIGVLLSDDIPKSHYQSAVEGWFKREARVCTIRDGYKLYAVDWEFKYAC